MRRSFSAAAALAGRSRALLSLRGRGWQLGGASGWTAQTSFPGSFNTVYCTSQQHRDAPSTNCHSVTTPSPLRRALPQSKHGTPHDLTRAQTALTAHTSTNITFAFDRIFRSVLTCLLSDWLFAHP